MWGPVEIVAWLFLAVIFIALFGYLFYKFTGRGRKGDIARHEGVRHEGHRD